MKFTMYTDGRVRTSIQVRHTHLGSVELVLLMCRYNRIYDGLDGPEDRTERSGGWQDGRKITKAELEKAVRQVVEWQGTRAFHERGDDDWAENLSSELEVLSLVQWAITTVRRLYPELDDDKLRQFEATWDLDRLNAPLCPDGCGVLLERHSSVYVCPRCANDWAIEDIDKQGAA